MVIADYFQNIYSYFVGNYNIIIKNVTLTAVCLFVVFVTNFITKKIVLRIIKKIVERNKFKWDDVLQNKKVFEKAARIVPAVILMLLIRPFFGESQEFVEIVQRFILSYIFLMTIFVLSAFLEAIVEIYETFKISKEKPIKGYVQLVNVIVYIFGIIIIIGTIINHSPWKLLSGIGAMTAIIMLVFKDSILGFVSSIQISGNNLLRIGDWIEMAKYGADGDVIDITLNTVKVQNWDKTISTIPTYAFTSESFKNWRGMKESGGRRIKRSISIDMTSIKFCDTELLDKFRGNRFLTKYIEDKEKEIDEYHKEFNITPDDPINSRKLTNLGTFRIYIEEYLKSNKNIHENMTFLVRHLKPNENGLPIEIYVFSNDQIWVNYEKIQADIFDHILAVLSFFELRVFQNPGGNDFKRLLSRE